MKTLIQSKQVKPQLFVVLFAAATMFTSCAPKYGCYYSMTETNTAESVECPESMNDADWTLRTRLATQFGQAAD